MNLDLEHKTAVATGASTGIGRSIAVVLAREGVRLAIAARREAAAGETVAMVTGAGGESPFVILKQPLDDGGLRRHQF